MVDAERELDNRGGKAVVDVRDAAPTHVEQVRDEHGGHERRRVQDHLAPDYPVDVQHQPKEYEQRDAARDPLSAKTFSLFKVIVKTVLKHEAWSDHQKSQKL